MTFYGTNATGWTQLIDGQMISAVFTMFDTAFLSWTVALLFIVYQFMLFLKTKNTALCWVTGIFFASLYAASTFVKTMSIQIIFVILVFELGIILYTLIWK